mgnify:CR=1 FL=1
MLTNGVNGCNRTIVGLKVYPLIGAGEELNQLQSHHSGIERATVESITKRLESSCNRTIVGLKDFATAPAQAPPPRCNRTIVGLKDKIGEGVVEIGNELQSHHSGIERRMKREGFIPAFSCNRTIVGLKATFSIVELRN